MISVAALDSDRRSGTILAELTDPAWDFPTTLAKVAGKLLEVCSQPAAQRTGFAPRLPFEVAVMDIPAWPPDASRERPWGPK